MLTMGLICAPKLMCETEEGTYFCTPHPDMCPTSRITFRCGDVPGDPYVEALSLIQRALNDQTFHTALTIAKAHLVARQAHLHWERTCGVDRYIGGVRDLAEEILERLNADPLPEKRRQEEWIINERRRRLLAETALPASATKLPN